MVTGSGYGNASLKHLLSIVSPEMGRIIVNSTPPKGGKQLTATVVHQPFKYQSVERWKIRKPMEITHMGEWQRISPPKTSPNSKWAKGAIVDKMV